MRAVIDFSSSAIIDDLYIFGTGIGPDKAQAELIVDPDAVLPLPVSRQSFQMVRRRRPQIGKLIGCVEHIQLPQRHGPNILKLRDCDSPE
jgi:hypothetical protein